MNITRIAPSSQPVGAQLLSSQPVIGRETLSNWDAISSEGMPIKSEMLICIIDSDEAVRRGLTRLLQAEQ